MPGGGPIRRIVGLVNPTPMIPPPGGRPLLWKLVSLLSLNFMSLVEGGAEALQELLRLHNLLGSAAGEKQIWTALPGLSTRHSDPGQSGAWRSTSCPRCKTIAPVYTARWIPCPGMKVSGRSTFPSGAGSLTVPRTTRVVF